MSEKLCLQCNDLKEIVNSAFGKLWCDEKFTDVTLVCEAGQQMDAHKVILVSSSPFFEKILQKSKHSGPLIYLKGVLSKDFASILNFIYFGEANVYQEDLDSLLAIAHEIKLKGLTGRTSSELLDEHEMPGHFEPAKMNNYLYTLQHQTTLAKENWHFKRFGKSRPIWSQPTRLELKGEVHDG